MSTFDTLGGLKEGAAHTNSDAALHCEHQSSAGHMQAEAMYY